MSEEDEIFCENPYDIETLLCAINSAQSQNVEYLLLDSVIADIRQNPEKNLVEVIFDTLKQMGFLQDTIESYINEKG